MSVVKPHEIKSLHDFLYFYGKRRFNALRFNLK